ncbi:MAG: hypothetical protein AAFP19_00475 [Bacteroidota bacterium]
MKALKYLSVLLLGLSLSFCTKPPDYPAEPIIEFISISRDTVVQKTINDVVFVTIGFTDGDGNLIANDTTHSVFVRDPRADNDFAVKPFGIPEIPEQGANNGISGEITLRIDEAGGFCCYYENGQFPCQPSTLQPVDTLIFEIQMEDKDGNKSNIIETAPIFIFCQ